MKKQLDIDLVMSNAERAADAFRDCNQEMTDSFVRAAYIAGFNNRIILARMAQEETRLGLWRDKVIKNVIATKLVYEDVKNLRTVGIISDNMSINNVRTPEKSAIHSEPNTCIAIAPETAAPTV